MLRQFFYIGLMVLILSGCIVNSRATYSSETLGVSLSYPTHWNLIETETGLSLEYEQDQLTEAGIYITVGEMNSFKGNSSIEILQNKIEEWERNDGEENFIVLQEPIINNDQNVAFTTAKVKILDPGGLGLQYDFYQETLVFSQDERVALVVVLYRGIESNKDISNEVGEIIDSLVINQ